jgi:hypothetical protein
MSISLKRRHSIFVIVLHLWWVLLSGRYLWSYWANESIAGADGSAHVAALQLYSTYVYPDTLGWLPEFFGGMPFPVYYPPLFYWLGATIIKLGGVDANLAAKILTTASFAALPSAILGLGRRLGLSFIEAMMSSAWSGVIACGSNLASLGGVGLLGLFEVGLYTQTLGFVFFCIWCGRLAHAVRSRTAAALAIISLTALILTNVHVLPLTAAFAFAWFIFDYGNRRLLNWKSDRARLIPDLIRPTALIAAPALLASIWLFPLIRWYTYSVGRPLDAPSLFSELGALNFVWPICVWVAWSERRHRRAMACLCIALLLVAIASLTPLGGVLKAIPFQPARALSSAVLLCTIPGAFLISRTMRALIGIRWLYRLSLASCVVVLAVIHPGQKFGISCLSSAEDRAILNVRTAVKELPPGLILVEIVMPSAIFNSSGSDIRALATSRALTHQIAMDHRPILWCVFREQAVTAPLATAVTNLFSTSQENFEIDGVALKRAAIGDIAPEHALNLASQLGVSYFLVNSGAQVDRLRKSPTVRLLWNTEGWYLFQNLARIPSAMEKVNNTPVMAWLSSHFKNRSPNDLDLFNLWEELSFNGHSDISVLWAQSPGADPWNLIARQSITTIVVDPSVVSNADDIWLWLSKLKEAAPRLNVILIDDGSPLAGQIESLKQTYAAYKNLRVQDPDAGEVLLHSLAEEIVTRNQSQNDATLTEHSLDLYRTNAAYFPAWKTRTGSSLFLTGQGGMAVLDTEKPSLHWQSITVRITSVLICLVGLAVAWVACRPMEIAQS